MEAAVEGCWFGEEGDDPVKIVCMQMFLVIFWMLNTIIGVYGTLTLTYKNQMAKISIKDTEITVIQVKNEDYICLTDMVKAKDGDFFLADWLRNRNTLEYIEGRATGIPTILKSLKENGSHAPRFNTDDDRTFFEVEIYIHPAFIEKMPFALDTGEPYPSLDGIDSVLNNLLRYCGIDHVAVINSVIAGVHAKNTFASINIIDNQANEVFAAVSMTIAGVVADVIANALTRNEIKLLEMALKPQIRETLFLYNNDLDQEIEDWNSLSEEQRTGIENALVQINSGKGIPHVEVISKYRNKYKNA